MLNTKNAAIFCCRKYSQCLPFTRLMPEISRLENENTQFAEAGAKHNKHMQITILNM